MSIMPSGGDVQEMGGSIKDDPPNNDSGTGSGGNVRGRYV